MNEKVYLDYDGLERYHDLLQQQLETKADKVSNSTSGNFASLTNDGNIADSGHAHSDYVLKTDLEEIEEVVAASLNDLNQRKADSIALAVVATSGSYNDLSDKPTIPTLSNFVQNLGIDYFVAGKALPTASAALENAVVCQISFDTNLTVPTISFKKCALYSGTYQWLPAFFNESNGTIVFTKTIDNNTTGYNIPTVDAVKTYVTDQIPSTLPASDVYSWAKTVNKPTYTASEVGINTSLVSVTGNLSNVTCPDTLANGQQSTVIYKNNGSAEYTVSVSTSSNYVTPDGQQLELTCPVGGYCEVSYLKVGDTIFVRGV